MQRLKWFPVLLLVVAVPLFVRATKSSTSAPAPVERAMKMFSGDAMKAHDRFLASDLLEGRGPGTRGDRLAINYIAAQFESYGLEPGGDNGTYIQKVALLGITTDADKTSVSFTKDGAPAIGPRPTTQTFVHPSNRNPQKAKFAGRRNRRLPNPHRLTDPARTAPNSSRPTSRPDMNRISPARRTRPLRRFLPMRERDPGPACFRAA